MGKKGHSYLGSAFFLASTAAFAVPFVAAGPVAILTGLTASYLAAELGQWQLRKVFGKAPTPAAPQPG